VLGEVEGSRWETHLRRGVRQQTGTGVSRSMASLGGACVGPLTSWPGILSEHSLRRQRRCSPGGGMPTLVQVQVLPWASLGKMGKGCWKELWHGCSLIMAPKGSLLRRGALEALESR
jgi:hypothetical protein